ncbi:MAG: hypothetical protein K2K35_11010 [Lachnospiraceae bacterium]|nr:hypothetical protein [Lachnospiraceae bacterium]
MLRATALPLASLSSETIAFLPFSLSAALIPPFVTLSEIPKEPLSFIAASTADLLAALISLFAKALEISVLTACIDSGC